MKADLILKGNAIYDSVGKTPKSGFVAIGGNKIIGIGPLNKMDAFTGPETKIIDAKDKLIMPGFNDNHTHLIMAGMYQVCVNLIDGKSEDEVCKMVADFEKEHPSKGDWVIGFGWYHVFWDNKQLPTKQSLDALFPDRPVFLLNAEAHGAWVNSKALEIAGVTKDTPDPFGGSFARDDNGEPTGFLYEEAVAAVTPYVFNFTEEQEKEYLRAYMKSAAEFGITSVTDVQPYFGVDMGNLETYSQLDKKGELSIRVHAAPNLLGDLDDILKLRAKYNSEKVRVDHLKQFLDGVSTTHTALVLEEYTDAPGNTGISLSPLEAIEKAVPEAHKRGFSVKLHSCGDKSCRYALDYFENAINLYGKNKQCRHAIEHIEMISDADIPRIKELEIIPSMQPEHIAITQTFAENPYPITIGEARANKTWPLKTMLKMAGVIAIGTDCPVVSNNPFLEIFRAVTRVHNDGKPEGGWNPTEKLTLDEVLTGYTYGSAYAALRENELGTLEVGKFADIIVLDQNLFELDDSWKILDTKVDLTIMDGNVVFKRD